jgi:hypothetical protein
MPESSKLRFYLSHRSLILRIFKDWKHHKVVCRGEAKTDSIIVTSPTLKKNIDDTITGNLRKDGRELNIELPSPGLPGGKVQLSSTTMSASWMKEFRDQVTQEVARRS